MLIKKGAMFGLDARIALAIFGALSVISGAALYSAIQEAKVTQFIANTEELAKAYTQYTLDTGHDLPFISVAIGVALNVEELVTSTEKSWKGPYVSWKVDSGVKYRFEDYEDYGKYHIYKSKSDNLVCETALPCYIWIRIGDVSSDMAKKVDLKIDGVDDATTGRIFYKSKGDGSGNNILLYNAQPALTNSKPV